MYFLLIIFLLLPAPLGLDWDKSHSTIPSVKEYTHHIGDLSQNPVVFLGTKRILDLETELQLYFTGNKIYKSLLILGPSGLNQNNCLQKFNQYKKLMTEKYGNPIMIREEDSFLKEEILYSSKCHLYRAGLKRTTVYWNTKLFQIESALLGDDNGFYIETSYVFKKTAGIKTNQEKNFIYRKISKEIKK